MPRASRLADQRQRLVGARLAGQQFSAKGSLVKGNSAVDIENRQTRGRGAVTARNGGNFLTHNMLHNVDSLKTALIKSAAIAIDISYTMNHNVVKE